MRRIRLLIGILLACAPFVLALSPAAAAAAVRYVALGDSYSSGVGAGSYLDSSGDCDRSSKAYPALWAAAHKPASYVSLACSGATTGDVVANQLESLSKATTLVSITVGGNDVGFSDVMVNCVVWSTSTCVKKVDAAENSARTDLPGALDTVYAAIRKYAPNATVVVLGYPRLYHVGVWYCVGLSDTARSKVNEGANVLDGVVRSAAARHGFVYADVRAKFANGHEICDGSGSWLHSVDWGDVSQSYHPTATGQSSGYLPVFTSTAR